MGLALQQLYSYLTTLYIVKQVHYIEVYIQLMDELGHAGAVHFAVEVRWQRRFYQSRELGLRLLAKSLIESLLCVQVSFQLCNFILHIMQQLYQLLHISRWLASHIDILMTRGGYCNVAQDSSIHRIPKYTQNQNDTQM